MPDTPTAPLHHRDGQDPTRPSTRKLLAVIGGIVLVLCGVFGYTIVRHRASFDAYVERTLVPGQMPWDARELSVDECAEFGTTWGMQCTGLESWCLAEAPRVTRMCMEAADRTEACRELGDAVETNRFGYHECEALREDVEGRYIKRGHKKYCAASYRAVAESCRAARR
jgi:hypothetical protein